MLHLLIQCIRSVSTTWAIYSSIRPDICLNLPFLGPAGRSRKFSNDGRLHNQSCLFYNIFRHNVLLEIVQKSRIFFPVSARITSKR